MNGTIFSKINDNIQVVLTVMIFRLFANIAFNLKR